MYVLRNAAQLMLLLLHDLPATALSNKNGVSTSFGQQLHLSGIPTVGRPMHNCYLSYCSLSKAGSVMESKDSHDHSHTLCCAGCPIQTVLWPQYQQDGLINAFAPLLELSQHVRPLHYSAARPGTMRLGRQPGSADRMLLNCVLNPG